MSQTTSVPLQTTVADVPRHAAVRADIQALRGWAVLLVILHHAQLLPARDAGYLGVDIFFVVSGFVITGLLLREQDAGEFSFAQFYARRARRLLPAAYVTFLVTAVLAPFFVLSDEMPGFVRQVAGALTFTANIVLWGQTGYFQPGALFKPLLHTWSLAIEEQFYMLWPLAMFWVPRAWRLRFAIFMCAASLLLCLAVNERMAGAAFYLLPTRVWELGLGCAGALAMQRPGAWTPGPVIRAMAIAVVALVPLHQWELPQPGITELVVCAATLLILVHRTAGNAAAALSPLVRTGDMSYSLYLVHWPVLSFAASAQVFAPDVATRIAMVVLAFLLTVPLHFFVEEPLRRVRQTPLRTFIFGAAGALVVAAAAWCAGFVSTKDATPGSLNFREGNVGLSMACEGDAHFANPPECRWGGSARMLLFGDSTAMHLADGLRASAPGPAGFVQATKTLCGPMLGIAVYNPHNEHNRQRAQGCVEFQRSVVSWLANQPQVEVVVLATATIQYLDMSILWDDGIASKARDGMPGVLAADRLAAMAHRLHAMGKRVVIVESIPLLPGFEAGRCLALRKENRVTLGAPPADCSIPRGDYEAAAVRIRQVEESAAKDANVPIVRLADTLCGPERCVVEADGVPLYRDSGHLSHTGSEWLGRKMNLYELLWSRAR